MAQFRERLKQTIELILNTALARDEGWVSHSGMGDKVSGIQVIGPDGSVKQEWHDD